MKFKDYKTYFGLRKMLTVAFTLVLVSASLSTPYAMADGRPGKETTPVYDYRDFMGPLVTQKKFADSRRDGSVVDKYQWLIRPQPEELIIEDLRSADGVDLSFNVWYFRLTDTDFLWYRNEVFDPMTGEEIFTDNFDPPLILRQSVMPQGGIHGEAVDVSRTLGGVEIAKFGATRSNTALGLDDVEVPYGTFSDCLRMWEEVNAVHRVSWYCPGVGLTKRIVGNLNNPALWELVNCIGCPDQPDQ